MGHYYCDMFPNGESDRKPLYNKEVSDEEFFKRAASLWLRSKKENTTKMTTPATIEIPFEEYINLCAAKEKLEALETFGVDGWSGYQEAMDSLEDIEEDLD